MDSSTVENDAELNKQGDFFDNGCRDDSLLREYFVFIKYITKGSYGRIFKVREKSTNSIYVLKLLKKNIDVDESESESEDWLLEREKRIMKNLKSHPFLVEFHSVIDTKDYIAIVMEYIDGLPMTAYLAKSDNGSIDEKNTTFYLAEISLAVHFLHKNGIIHRDIKLANIMMNGDGHVKLIDFGYSKDGLGFGDTTSTDMCLEINAAPELFKDVPYTFSVDWYAVGIVLHIMLTGDHPFAIFSDDRSMADIEKDMISAMYKKKFVFEEDISDEAISILEGLLKPEPGDRLGSKDTCDYMEIGEHGFLKNINWVKLEKKEIEPPFVPKREVGSISDFKRK